MHRKTKEVVLRLAAERIEGRMKFIDPFDPASQRKGVACGFRWEDTAFVAHLTWKCVKYAGKESVNFTLKVFSLDPERTVKVQLERIIPGGVGKKRPISLPQRNIEAIRKFKMEI